MNIFGKIIVSIFLPIFFTVTTYGAYEAVNCDSDPAFVANSCGQCFSGGDVVEGDNKGLLSDVWENDSTASQVLFKEEQDMPKMLNLGGATWKEVKASDNIDFWQYTSDLDAIYDEDNIGYTLEPGKSVTWIESTLGSAYNLVSNPAEKGANVGMITYDVAVHEIEADGNIALSANTARECVLFKSGKPGTPPVIPETPELPQTGPEFVFLAIAALLLGFGLLKFRKKA